MLLLYYLERNASVLQMYIDIMVMNREIENKQMIYVAKKLFKLMTCKSDMTVLNVTIFCESTVPKVSFLDC